MEFLYISLTTEYQVPRPFPRPRTVREAYGTGYALFFTEYQVPEQFASLYGQGPE